MRIGLDNPDLDGFVGGDGTYHFRVLRVTDALREAAGHFCVETYGGGDSLSDSGKVARLAVSREAYQCFGVKGYVLKKGRFGKPIPTVGIYWSLSHKEVNESVYIAVAVSDTPIGIDIERIVEKSDCLLESFARNEYDALGGESLDNFFSLWTAKEALIKKMNGSLDDMKSMMCVGFDGESVLLEYQHKIHKSRVISCSDGMVVSVCR